MNPGMMGVIGGLMGAVLGTYFSIKNTKTPAERRFMVKVSIGGWVMLFLLLGLLLPLSIVGVIPQWIVWLAFGLVLILVVPMALWVNKQQAKLREE